MDMDSIIMQMREDELKSMKELMAQYQKEICDLRSGTGLVKTMSKKEIMYAEKNLEDHIASLSESIMNFERTYGYAM